MKEADIMEKGTLDATSKVEANIEKQIALKKRLLSSLVRFVNEVCTDNGLSYFAMGDLLSYALTGDQEFLQREEFLIGMLRTDYDLFFESAPAMAEKRDITVKSFYAMGAANRKNSSLLKSGTLKEQSENFRMLINLRIEPFDELPDDPVERKDYISMITQQGNNLRNESFGLLRRIRDLRRTHRLYNPVTMAGDLFRLAKINSERKKYHSALCRYISDREDSDVARLEFVSYPAHSKSEILPVRTVSVDGYSLMIPNDTESLRSMTEADRKAWILDAYRETLQKIDRISAEFDIPYFIMGDLLVTSVHNGDFDINEPLQTCGIGLLRKDYDRLIGKLHEGMQSLKLFEYYEEYPHVHSRYAGVIDSAYVSKNHQDETSKLILYPFDSLPDDYECQAAIKKQAIDAYDRLREIQTSEKGNNDITQTDTSGDQFVLWQNISKGYDNEEPESKQIFSIVENRIKAYRREDIFPLRRKAFSTFEIWAPANEFIDHNVKDELYTNYISEQRLPILKKVDEICQAQNIPYFAVTGLLIGAAIYHDVLPESDDKEWELGLIRKDYNTFREYMIQHGHEYGLQFNEFLDKDEKYRRIHCSVSNYGDSLSKVEINILPFDKIPEDKYLQMGFVADLTEKDRLYREFIRINSGEMRERSTRFPEDIEKLHDYNLAEATEYILERVQLFNDDDRTQLYGCMTFVRTKYIPEYELFPLQRLEFRGIEINCPHDYNTWQPMLNDELERQVKAIQKADLILLEEFDRACNELGVGYFICGGTMLGYMRHGGFIPWDNDVDCAMLREDYEYFIRNADKVLGERFFLQTRDTDETIPYLFSKIRLKDTEYVTDYSDARQYHQGICLDIFPFDYLPNDLRARNEMVKEAERLRVLHSRAARLQYPIPTEEVEPRNDIEKKYIEDAKETLRQNWAVDLNVSQRAYLKNATAYNAFAERDQLTTVACFAPSYTFIDLKDLLPYQRGIFENIEVSIPRRPDVFLEMQYGDYMQLPPPHQRIAHRLVRWSTWEESSEDVKPEEGK